ncbi:MAG: hypothetical protein RJA70_1525 [Pseudomonadota bacterium]|jgi:hypothetical protein
MTLSAPATKNSASTSIAEAAEGFAGHVQVASLADVVQLRCLSNKRASMRVQCDGKVGLLFFDRGQLVHAMIEGEHQAAGVEAALEILSWPYGIFDSPELVWPNAPELQTSWQHLLLMGAQRLDERRRGETQTLDAKPRNTQSDKSQMVSIPAERRLNFQEKSRVNHPINDRTNLAEGPSSGSSVRPDELLDNASNSDVPTSRTAQKAALTPPSFTPKPTLDSGTLRAPSRAAVVRRPESDPTATLFAQADYAVRLDRAGRVLWSHRDNEELVGQAAYLARILDLIADELAAGQLQSFECDLGDRRLFMYSETKEVFMALLLPTTTNTTAFRAQLNAGPPPSSRSDQGGL